MKTNKTKIAFKILRMIRKLEPEDWNKILTTVDSLYFSLRRLETKETTTPQDEIEEIEGDLKEIK